MGKDNELRAFSCTDLHPDVGIPFLCHVSADAWKNDRAERYVPLHRVGIDIRIYLDVP